VFVSRDVEPIPTFDLPCGGIGALVQTAAGNVLAACPNDDRVVDIEGTLQAFVARPAALVVVDEVLHVASRDRVVLLDATTLETLGEEVVDRPEGASVSPITVLAVDPSGDVAAVYTVVDNDDRTHPPEQGGYGSVVAATPHIHPRVYPPDCGGPYALFDGGERVFSGPTAAAFDPQGRLWIVHGDTRNVAVLECDKRPASDEIPTLVANQRIGAGARGIVIAEDGESAFVDVGFDHAVAYVTLDEAPTSRTRAPDITLFSDAALRGRRIFFDATNTHLTPSGILTCGTCHPAGGEDGLSWFLHTTNVPRKVRRTPGIWGADPTIKPLHWDGEFGDAEVLIGTTIRELMGGDGLVISASDVAAFMAELTPPPGAPHDPAEVASGESVFASADCATCHSGPEHTDGAPHSVLTPSGDDDRRLDQVVTPSLLGVRGRGPWLHDGRADTLRSVLTDHNPDDAHGITGDLDPDDLDRLLLYLETL
jgi:cytochrome c553